MKIWRLLGFSHTKTLRQVCSVIKQDIDQFTGISSAIDSTFDDFSFHCSTAIRKVAIHELVTPTYVEFLKYPLILQELEIRGEISLQNYLYIIKSCPNISKLLIMFNKFVIDYKTQFFPLPSELVTLKLFSKLQTVKLISATKTHSEMFYIFRTIVSLLRDTVPDAKITILHVSVAHKSSNVFFNEIMWTTLVFIHKHAPSLKYLNLLFRDKEENSLAADVADTTDNENENESNENDDFSNNPQTKTTSNEGAKSSNKSNSTGHGGDSAKPQSSKDGQPEQQHSNSSLPRRDTGALPLASLPTVSITHHHHHHHVKDIHSEDAGSPLSDAEGEADVEEADKSDETNDKIKEAMEFLNTNAWPTADNLEHLSLTLHLNCMEQILKMISPKTKLHSLHLEMLGGLQSNWNFYKEFMQKAFINNLRSVTLLAVNHSSRGRSLPIDLGIFRKCKELTKLKIFCQKRDDFSKLSRAKNVSSLPQKIYDINFERVLFTPWQIFRFLVCFDGIQHMAIAYWSINDCQFSLLMTILKLVVKMDLSYIRKLYLVDTKIRFKNNRRAVRKLQQAVDISVRYQDYDETRLIIDVTEKPDDKALAPRISIKQVSDDHLTKGIKRIRKRLSHKGHSKGSNVSIASSSSEMSL